MGMSVRSIVRFFLPAAILASAVLSGCSSRAKGIPARKLSSIYAEMFLSDQWLRDHSAARRTADTTLFYEPVFRSYGYTTRDYDATVNYYLDHPEQYAKILHETVAILDKEATRLQKIKDRIDGINEWNASIKGYVEKTFSLDSLHMRDSFLVWPPRTDSVAVDSLLLDSLRLDSLRLDSLRLDSLRRDSLRRDEVQQSALRRRPARRNPLEDAPLHQELLVESKPEKIKANSIK